MLKQLVHIINLRKLFTICFLLLFSHQALTHARISKIKGPKSTLYFGHFTDLPVSDFCVLYDGELVQLHDASFTIKDTMLGSINILFVDPEKIKFVTEDGNTIVRLKLETKNYTNYRLEITQLPIVNPVATETIAPDYVSSWKIEEKTVVDEIALNTIVVPLDPTKLEIKLENVAGKPNNLAIKLPNIKLTSRCEQTLKELMIEGYLKAILLKPFHTKQQVKSSTQNTTKISMIL